MPNRNKEKGTRFEHAFKNALEMMSFECIRAYSSIGTADLIFSPPWNLKKNYRSLLVQCKDTKGGDYIDPLERDKLTNLQQRNSGLVIIAFKEKSKVMIKMWESKEIVTFEKFILTMYGIKCEYPTLLKKYREYNRPIHLYPVEKEEYIKRDGTKGEKPIAAFQDFYAVKPFYPHVPERFR